MNIRIPAAASETPERSEWVDNAKAIAIVGVVLFHASALASGSGFSAQYWKVIGLGIFTFIIPLFFLLSGLFVGKSLFEPVFRFLINKSWPMFYVWLVWSAGFAVLYAISAGSLGYSIVESVTLRTVLWYLFALALYLATARMLSPIPRGVQLGGAFLLSIPFAVLYPFEGWGLAHTPHYFVFFLFACCYKDLVTEFLTAKRTTSAWVLVLTFTVLFLVALMFPESQRVAYAIAPLIVVPSLLLISEWLTKWRRITKIFSVLGKRTLSIFLVHPVVLQLFEIVAERPSFLDSSLVKAVLPLIATVTATLAGLLVWVALKRVPGIFAPPKVL